MVPTRELAVQVGEDLKKAGGKLGARVLTIYGGRAYEPQIEALASRASTSSSAPRAGCSTWPTASTST